MVTFPEGSEAAVFWFRPGEGENEGEAARSLPHPPGVRGSCCGILRLG